MRLKQLTELDPLDWIILGLGAFFLCGLLLSFFQLDRAGNLQLLWRFLTLTISLSAILLAIIKED